MIQSFRDKRAERLFRGARVPDFEGFALQAEKRLRLLDAADGLQALRMLPSNRFEALKGDRADNIASASIGNGGSASNGMTTVRMRSRSWTITDEGIW